MFADYYRCSLLLQIFLIPKCGHLQMNEVGQGESKTKIFQLTRKIIYTIDAIFSLVISKKISIWTTDMKNLEPEHCSYHKIWLLPQNMGSFSQYVMLHL